jgi:threonine/homoserine/homoserine lactone efflux protein
MALSPGPNMIHLISRAMFQGRRAASYSLFGVACGFVVDARYSVWLNCGDVADADAISMAALCGRGLSDVSGVANFETSGRSPLQLRKLQPQTPLRLFSAGLLTNLLNPKLRCFIYRYCRSSLTIHRAAY